MKLTKGCAVCEDISDALMAPYEEAISFYIGSIEEMSSTPCAAHLELLALLLKPTILEEPCSMIMVHKFRDPYIRLFADSEDEDDYNITSSRGFGLVKQDSTGYARILDSQSIDYKLMEKWKSDCSSLHASECMRLPNSAFLAPASPNWLVDVHQKCIVPGGPGMVYVALSYVWGRARNFRAMGSNKQQLQHPGALGPGGFDIPGTIRDAMSVVGILQEKYLWVDALCIIQDEDSTKQAQLNNMASIYAEAIVTIIAKDGHGSSHGLHGIPGSVARNLNQDIFKLTNGREAIVHPWTVDKTRTPWASRGWTFQEYLFSPRKLIFEEQTIR
jgi:Heterokaryon incompatibility protein (HET)